MVQDIDVETDETFIEMEEPSNKHYPIDDAQQSRVLTATNRIPYRADFEGFPS